MGLFHLVEEDDRVRLAADRFGQLAALLIADVSGRRPDQAGHREFLHIFAHIDPDHVLLVVEEASRRGSWPARSCRRRWARGRGRSRSGDWGSEMPARERRMASVTFSTASSWPITRLCRISSRWRSFSRSPSISRCTGMPVQRSTIRAISSSVTLLRSSEFCFPASTFCSSSSSCFLQGRQLAVFQFSGLVEVVFPFGPLDLGGDILDLLTEFWRRRRWRSSRSPIWLSSGRTYPVPRPVPSAARSAAPWQRESSSLPMAASSICSWMMWREISSSLGRHRVHLGADHRAGFVDQVDRLIRQEPVGDIPAGEGDGGDDRLVGDLDAVDRPHSAPSGRAGSRWYPPRVGSSTMTGWNRRSSAASFSIYCRYSFRVVAPMQCSSPRGQHRL